MCISVGSGTKNVWLVEWRGLYGRIVRASCASFPDTILSSCADFAAASFCSNFETYLELGIRGRGPSRIDRALAGTWMRIELFKGSVMLDVESVCEANRYKVKMNGKRALKNADSDWRIRDANARWRAKTTWG